MQFLFRISLILLLILLFASITQAAEGGLSNLNAAASLIIIAVCTLTAWVLAAIERKRAAYVTPEGAQPRHFSTTAARGTFVFAVIGLIVVLVLGIWFRPPSQSMIIYLAGTFSLALISLLELRKEKSSESE